jgi:predicted DsbA family dithiol-disulfide isomerase
LHQPSRWDKSPSWAPVFARSAAAPICILSIAGDITVVKGGGVLRRLSLIMNAVKVVSDVICPWCYIGKRRLESALRSLPGKSKSLVSWHPFQLNPEMPAEGMDRMEYCVNKFGSWDRCEEMFGQISSVGKTVGLQFRFDLQKTIPNTFAAHRMVWLAGVEGVQDRVVEALFRGYFCEGADLSDRAQLAQLGVGAGLARARVEEFLASDEGAPQVQAEEQEVKALGISAVPLFIIQDRVAVSGAQPPETLLKAFEQARTTIRRQRSVTPA